MKIPPPVWDGVLRRLETELPDFVMQAWIRPLRAAEGPDGLRLLAPSAFHRSRLEARLLGSIEAAASELTGAPVRVRVEVGSGEARAVQIARGEVAPKPRVARAGGGATPGRPPRPVPAPGEGAPALAVSGPPPAPEQAALPYTFEGFVVGPDNALAREATLAVARGRRLGAGPLFLTGATGNGKTHLVRALHGVARRHHRDRAICVSAEGFTTELLRSIRGRETGRFKRRFREESQLLVIEDVQFFGGKASSQLELFHTLEHLRAVGTPVVLTADRLPRDIPDLEPRLGSQMASGLVAEIEPPGAELRRAILRAKAAAGGVRLPDECLERLVESVRGSVRDLEGVLIQLVQSAALLKAPIDLELTERALRKVGVGATGSRGRLEVAAVIEVVAGFFGLRAEELRSRSRRRAVLVPRQLAMYLCRRYTEASLAEVGRALGRDHPSVRNAVSVVERAILERAPLRYQVEALSTRLDHLTSGTALLR